MRSPHWPRALGLARASRRLWVLVDKVWVTSACVRNEASSIPNCSALRCPSWPTSSPSRSICARSSSWTWSSRESMTSFLAASSRSVAATCAPSCSRWSTLDCSSRARWWAVTCSSCWRWRTAACWRAAWTAASRSLAACRWTLAERGRRARRSRPAPMRGRRPAGGGAPPTGWPSPSPVRPRSRPPRPRRRLPGPRPPRAERRRPRAPCWRGGVPQCRGCPARSGGRVGGYPGDGRGGG